jgi:hypothetical protein
LALISFGMPIFMATRMQLDFLAYRNSLHSSS